MRVGDDESAKSKHRAANDAPAKKMNSAQCALVADLSINTNIAFHIRQQCTTAPFCLPPRAVTRAVRATRWRVQSAKGPISVCGSKYIQFFCFLIVNF
jgi:hypothetical protein